MRLTYINQQFSVSLYKAVIAHRDEALYLIHLMPCTITVFYSDYFPYLQLFH